MPDYYARQVSELAGPLSFIVKVNVEDLDSDAVFAFSLDNAAAQNFSIDDQGNIFIRDQQVFSSRIFSFWYLIESSCVRFARVFFREISLVIFF